MFAGKRTTFITVEQRQATQDPVYGTTVATWNEFAQMWAEVQDVLPSRSESLEDGVSIQNRPARVRVSYFDGLNITSNMRIKIGERTLRIVSGPAELQKPHGWEMRAEEVSTQGEEP